MEFRLNIHLGLHTVQKKKPHRITKEQINLTFWRENKQKPLRP